MSEILSESDVPQEIKQGAKDIGEGILSMSKSLEKLTTGVNGLCTDMRVLCKDMGWSIKIVCVAVSAYLMVKTVRAAW